MVAVAGTARSLEVIARRRIELVEPGTPKQPYHAAEKLNLNDAEKLIQRCTQEASILAYRAMGAALEALCEKGYEVSGCGVLLGSHRRLPPLGGILASHALIHTAEGVFFRDALVRASEDCHLPVTGVREKELLARAANDFRMAAEEFQRRVAEAGRDLGPPWRQDEKYATGVALLALAASP